MVVLAMIRMLSAGCSPQPSQAMAIAATDGTGYDWPASARLLTGIQCVLKAQRLEFVQPNSIVVHKLAFSADQHHSQPPTSQLSRQRQPRGPAADDDGVCDGCPVRGWQNAGDAGLLIVVLTCLQVHQWGFIGALAAALVCFLAC